MGDQGYFFIGQRVQVCNFHTFKLSSTLSYEIFTRRNQREFISASKLNIERCALLLKCLVNITFRIKQFINYCNFYIIFFTVFNEILTYINLFYVSLIFNMKLILFYIFFMFKINLFYFIYLINFLCFIKIIYVF